MNARAWLVVVLFLSSLVLLTGGRAEAQGEGSNIVCLTAPRTLDDFVACYHTDHVVTGSFNVGNSCALVDLATMYFGANRSPSINGNDCSSVGVTDTCNSTSACRLRLENPTANVSWRLDNVGPACDEGEVINQQTGACEVPPPEEPDCSELAGQELTVFADATTYSCLTPVGFPRNGTGCVFQWQFALLGTQTEPMTRIRWTGASCTMGSAEEADDLHDIPHQDAAAPLSVGGDPGVDLPPAPSGFGEGENRPEVAGTPVDSEGVLPDGCQRVTSESGSTAYVCKPGTTHGPPLHISGGSGEPVAEISWSSDQVNQGTKISNENGEHVADVGADGTMTPPGSQSGEGPQSGGGDCEAGDPSCGDIDPGECDPEVEECGPMVGLSGCGQPPSCEGDAIGCAMIRLQWENACAHAVPGHVQSSRELLGSHPADGGGRLHEDVDVSTVEFDTSGFGGAQCVQDVELPIPVLDIQVTVPFSEWCPMLEVASYLLILLASWVAVRVVAGASVGLTV